MNTPHVGEPSAEEVGGIYKCWNCDKRLNVDDVRGSVVVICPGCKKKNRIRTSLVN